MDKEQKEQRIKRFEISGGVCEVCGKPLMVEGSQMQLAHRIGQTQVNIKKYGTFFINSPYNSRYVCSLGCNASVDVGKSKGRILDTLADILLKEMADFRGE